MRSTAIYGAISPAVNGARPEMNNFTIDGVEDNELFFDFAAINPPPDALREFNVQTNMTSGQYGRAAGANINIVTQSGGNQFHGAAWEFLRNTDLDARNFFNPAVSIFHQNQFGGTLGGPFLRNKIWGFGWYEGFRKTLGSTILELVPTNAQLNGDLSGCTARSIIRSRRSRSAPTRKAIRSFRARHFQITKSRLRC